jgi:flagellar biosynthesis component FlhA
MKMRKSKTIKIDDKEITASEITALESQQYIESLSNDEGSFIDELFPDGLPASLIRLCTGLKEEELLAFTPSEIELIMNAVEEINPTTASRIKKLAEIGRKMMERDPDLMQKLQDLNLKKTAAD